MTEKTRWYFVAADDTPGHREPAAVYANGKRWEPVGSVFDPAETERVGRLIAAAPDMAEALAWYGEQARLARLIHSEGDAGRHALAVDGGAKARAALLQARGEAG